MSLRSRLLGVLKAFAISFKVLGVRNAARFWLQRLGVPLERGGENITLRARYCSHPLYARPGTTDAFVFRNIFLERHYACVDALEGVGAIVDCGANVGYSAAYFLTMYPHATLVAVEPDAENYEMLKLNTAPYAERITTIRAGVWSHVTTLVMSDGAYRGGREWSRQVREARSGEAGGFPAVDVASLLRQSGHERISILKMDIEGAEAVVFSEGYESWLALVDTIVIELHDDSVFGDGSRVFADAISRQSFDVRRVHDLTVCTRRRG